MTNILILSASLLSIILGSITLFKNPRSLSNLSFVLLSFTMAVWAVLFIPYTNPFLFDSIVWIKAIYVMVSVMVGMMVFFGYSFPYGDKPNWKVLLLYTVLNIPILYTLFYTNLFVKGVEQTVLGTETYVGSFYWYGSLVWGSFAFGGAVFNLIRKYRKARGTAKFQLLYMFWGLGIFGGAAMVLDGVIPLLFHTSKYFALSAVFSFSFVGLTAYSIVRHRLLDIRVALQEVVVFSTKSFLISIFIIFGAIVYWHANAQLPKIEVFPVITVISFIIVILYERISYMAQVFAKFLRLSVYDYQKALSEISLHLSANLELQKLIEEVSKTLVEIFKVSKIAILLYDNDKKRYVLQNSLGFEQSREDIEILFNSFTTVYFSRTPKILDLEELRKLAEKMAVGFETNSLKQLAQIMSNEKLSLIIPLVSNNKIIGITVLGDKASLDPYTVQDINFLNTMAYEASTAFQNAKSYEEIQRFNVTLKEEVDEATSELKQANTKLEQLDKLKDDFVSVASHELRTPMTAIRSYAWMALHKADMPLSDRMQKYLIRVLISTERLINLVNDMLNVSRIESGRIEVVPESVDLKSLVRDIVDEVYYSKSQEKQIQFIVLEKQIPKAFADPEKLRQVLLNLVGNSLKFTPDGGKISFDFFSDGKTIEISVKDSGVGISKEDLGRLFQKFGRLDNSYIASASSGGTGLGLFISKNLIQLMHGRIWATSEGLGKGTTVTVSLPVANAETLKHAAEFTIKTEGEAKPLEPVAI